MLKTTTCRLGVTRHIGPNWLRLTVLNAFDAWSLHFRGQRLAWKPINYSRYTTPLDGATKGTPT